MSEKSKKLIQALGALMVVDGFLLLSFGRRYIRIWRFGPSDNPYRRGLDWLTERPSWLLRSLGLAEAGIGVSLLGPAAVESPSPGEN
jgi:hypothetical protein